MRRWQPPAALCHTRWWWMTVVLESAWWQCSGPSCAPPPHPPSGLSRPDETTWPQGTGKRPCAACHLPHRPWRPLHRRLRLLPRLLRSGPGRHRRPAGRRAARCCPPLLVLPRCRCRALDGRRPCPLVAACHHGLEERSLGLDAAGLLRRGRRRRRRHRQGSASSLRGGSGICRRCKAGTRRVGVGVGVGVESRLAQAQMLRVGLQVHRG